MKLTTNMTMTAHSLLTFVAAALVALSTASAETKPLAIPDFTKGGAIPAGATHDWNLGATGARGWMVCDKMVTTDARQIRITKVEENSPAAGALAVGDVILGVGGKPFACDPRTEMGKALIEAEKDANRGSLSLIRWRDGKTDTVTLKLQVLGSYSATAPFDCPKSKRILEQGCKALAARVAAGNERQEPITRCLNALALLASGNPDYLPLVRKEAEWASGFTSSSMQTWRYGYVIILLSEYMMATGDQSVMPGLRRLALEAAKGQSAVGSWGHGFALPDGRLRGYGMMNAPGLPLTTSLILAREAGLKDPAVDLAIARSNRLLSFYIGKGAIPYGDHAPWIESHEDNGKCGIASLMFNQLGNAAGAEYFSRMSIASHGPERDTGHTGNFFNILWALPGVAQSGPNATGAWMQEFGAWYFDLARRWDGSFPHQGPPELKGDSYDKWDATGAILLGYAMPLRKIRLTGKKPGVVSQLTAAAAQAVVLDGRGWSNKDRTSFYASLSTKELIERLGSWSTVVRERAATELARRKDDTVPELAKMLDAPNLNSRYGACQALARLKGRASPAIPALTKNLKHDDIWLRIKAAEALAAIGAPAMQTVPELLEMLAHVDKAKDSRGMQQRYLSFALFDEREGMLARSLDGVDRGLLYSAVRAGLNNEDGRSRGSIGSVYRKLTYEEIKPLLPAILEAIVTPAPSGEMFADAIRVEGLKVLAKHHIKEGIAACVNYTTTQNPWASQKRTPELMKILLGYGAQAKAVIPELQKIADGFEKGEPDFPKALSLQKATSVRETIRAIESATNSPGLISITK